MPHDVVIRRVTFLSTFFIFENILILIFFSKYFFETKMFSRKKMFFVSKKIFSRIKNVDKKDLLITMNNELFKLLSRYIVSDLLLV